MGLLTARLLSPRPPGAPPPRRGVRARLGPLALGVLARPSALALASTMGLAVFFHIDETGLEGFPLAVVEGHQYHFEAAGLYALIFLWFLFNGPGRFSVSGGK